jgi:S-adenosylmethionine:tRNA ribosyltransferase-isomerase
VSAPLSIADFDYLLPPERIAQHPLAERDAARLMVLDRQSDERRDSHVVDLPELLEPGDLLVMNATRVDSARLRGQKESGGRAEALLLGRTAESGRHLALVRARGKLRVGAKFRFERDGAASDAEIVEIEPDGRVVLAFPEAVDPYSLGEMPLPPYIERAEAELADRERYQTVFAREPGSVAAPTAGLHLTSELLARCQKRGVQTAEVILHVGVGTFRPVRDEDVEAGRLHPERFDLPEATATAIAATRERGGRVAAVGTTTTRVLEHAHTSEGRVAPGAGVTGLFLKPGDPFHVVDALLTNFHLPRSSLLMLVAAFCGRERILDAYAAAVEAEYRFYSYGDAMWIHG